MVALNNARNKSRGEPTDLPHCEGQLSNAPPEAPSAQSGVSVENAQSAMRPIPLDNHAPPRYNDGKPHWFVLRVS
ncbi:MAG: hypothetical protein SOV40_08665, partial [Prevotella sp.]|nr:hypothetical protein [Prevotella sp.]